MSTEAQGKLACQLVWQSRNRNESLLLFLLVQMQRHGIISQRSGKKMPSVKKQGKTMHHHFSRNTGSEAHHGRANYKQMGAHGTWNHRHESCCLRQTWEFKIRIQATAWLLITAKSPEWNVNCHFAKWIISEMGPSWERGHAGVTFILSIIGRLLNSQKQSKKLG